MLVWQAIAAGMGPKTTMADVLDATMKLCPPDLDRKLFIRTAYNLMCHRLT